jgi:predicted MFS family arabinose efflux permease
MLFKLNLSLPAYMILPALQLYKNAYSGLTKNTWWLSLVMLINRSGTMVVPFMTMYMTQHLGVGIAKAGFVMSVFGAGSIIGALLGGKITDKIGFYPVQLFTLIAGGTMFIVLGQMKSYTAICVASFILSIVNEAFRPANAVAIAHYSNQENRTRSYSLNRLSINLGWAFGAGLGGLVASYNYHLLFWVDGITNIAAALLLVFVLSPAKKTVSTALTTINQPVKKSAYKDRQYLFFIFLQVIFAMCFFQMYTIQPVYYKTQLHLSESFIGFTMALNGLIIALVEMVLVFKLEGRKQHFFYISIGTVLVGISFLMVNILPLGPALLSVLVMCCLTLGEMLSMPFMNAYWISRTNNDNRGQYAALYTVGWSAAQIIGPAIGGQIVEQHSFATLWWITAISCFLLSFIYYKMIPVNQ